MYSGEGSTPIPDPTRLTQAAVKDGVATVREILEAEIDGDLREINATLAGMAEAVKLLQAWRENQAGAVDAKIDQAIKIVNERFNTVGQQFEGIKTEFKLRDDYTNRAEEARKEELKTALSSAEKAVDKQATAFEAATDKSGNATGELLKQQAELLRSTKEGIDTQLSDLKVRLATAEAVASAAREAAATATANASAAAQSLAAQQRFEKTDNRADQTIRQGSNSYALAIAGFVGGTLIGVAGIVLAIVK